MTAVSYSLKGITFSHNKQFGLVTSQNDGMLCMFDKRRLSKVKFRWGTQPYSVAISEMIKTAYVTNEALTMFPCVNLTHKKTIATISVGNSPHGIVLIENE